MSAEFIIGAAKLLDRRWEAWGESLPLDCKISAPDRRSFALGCLVSAYSLTAKQADELASA